MVIFSTSTSLYSVLLIPSTIYTSFYTAKLLIEGNFIAIFPIASTKLLTTFLSTSDMAKSDNSSIIN